MDRARPLAHPLPLACVVTMIVNDHVLKGSGLLPGSVTGKLSDLAGLFFFPVFLVSLSRWARPTSRSRPFVAAALTMIVFAAVKVWRPANALYAALLGPLAMDPTDLLALPCALLAALWMQGLRGRPSSRIGLGERLAVIVAGAGSMATSAMHLPPCKTTLDRPVPRDTMEQTCLSSKGFDLRRRGALVEATLVVESRGGPCPLDLDHAVLEARPTSGLRVRTRGKVTKDAASVEQGKVTVNAVFLLPTTAAVTCASLLPIFERSGHELVVPVASCEEQP